MRFWRLSEARYAQNFDGGYGLRFDGRWSTRGHAVTYCSTVASLCALEKRVHVFDPDLMPEQLMVEYEAADDLPKTEITPEQLPSDWVRRQAHTQRLGDGWLEQGSEPLLIVPSAMVPIASAPDRNLLINHRHSDASSIRIVDAFPFILDVRLFRR
jgi:RES domain-containing protein